MRYRADVDGLRAIAVTAVILGHFGVPGAGGGFVGVDVFFVISGFLITAMIAPDAAARQLSLLEFYQRRIRRIAPAFFAMTAAISVAAWVLVPPTDLARYGQSLAATSSFSSNLLFWRQEGYFDSGAHAKPMLHTWSLAVEEQFYLVYPLLMAALYRAWPRRVPLAIGALAIASLGACVAITATLPRAAFYLMPLRSWELLIGALLALDVVPALGRRWQRELAATVGLGLIVGAIALVSGSSRFPGAIALVPCLGAALLIHAHAGSAHAGPAHAGSGPTSTIVGAVLRARPVVFVGAISYSLYLWHWPLLVLIRYAVLTPTTAQLAAVAAATVALAALSWRFIEQPVRRARSLSRRAVFLGWAIATALTLGFGLLTVHRAGWPGRVAPAVRALDRASADFNHDRPRCHGSDRRPIAFADKCVYGRADVAPTLAVWGDSMAAELAIALGPAAAAHGQALLAISYTSCPPAQELDVATRPGCRRHDDEMLTQLAASPTITTVILVAQYKRYLATIGPAFLPRFAAAATALARAGKRVVIVYPIPTPPGAVPRLLASHAMRGGAPTDVAIPRARYEAENRVTIAALDALIGHDGIVAVRPSDRLCDAARCIVYADGQVLYWDDRHLSVTGATTLVPLFAAAVEWSRLDAVSPPSP